MRVNASCPTCRKRIFDSGEPAGAPTEGNNSSGGTVSNTTGGAPTGTSSGGSNTNTGSSMNPMFMFTGSSGRGTGGSTTGNVSGEVALNSYPTSVSGVGSSSSRFSLINTRMATASSAGGYSLIPTSSHGGGHQHSSSGVGSRSGGDLIDTADQGEEGRQQQQEHDPSHLV